MLLKKKAYLLIIALFVAVFVFLKNAWVTEDAYIIYRSLEQLFTGNGPIWNPHERVQAFTSPLWFYVLAFFRAFSVDVYLNAILASGILWIGTFFVLYKIFRDNFILLIAILLLSASSAFFDYTSSGLENVLAYFLIALYFLHYSDIFMSDLNDNGVRKKLKITIMLFGLLICVRHDLLLLLLPSLIYVLYRTYKVFTISQWMVYGVLGMAPFTFYSIFSLIYYGFPFPNTAYAKLNTGIDKTEIINQGMYYLYSSVSNDFVTVFVIFSAFLVSFLKRFNVFFKYFLLGVFLNLLYVVNVGGDFMQGRFLSYSYLLSLIILMVFFKNYNYQKYGVFLTGTIFLYLFLYPNTPFLSPVNYSRDNIVNGIADERGYYFEKLSLVSYVTRNKNFVFPTHDWSLSGAFLKQTNVKIHVEKHIGFFGYQAGTKKIILDVYALTEPLLARMPVTGERRIGHFMRGIPKGYIESLLYNTEVIHDKNINNYYKKLKLITQSDDLFSSERMKTIFLFNLGVYDRKFLK